MTTYPKTTDPVGAFTRADGTTELHSADHGRVIGIWENVKHYGATGNGTTDDTAAITAAIAAASSGTGTVYFPHGTYKITSSIDVGNYQHIRFQGAGNLSGSSVPGPYTPGALIDARTITTGPAFTFNGLTAGIQTAVHVWDSIYIHAGRTGWYYDNAVRVTFKDCGVYVFTNDGNADNAAVVIINSFWFEFKGGTYQAPSTSDPAIILRGRTLDQNVNTTYLVSFDHIRFTFGGVRYEMNTGGTVSSEPITFDHCWGESFNGQALMTFTESGAHAAVETGSLTFQSCHMYDQSASAPFLENQAADLTITRPLFIDCQQQIGAAGALQTAGTIRASLFIAAGAAEYGSFAQDGSANLTSMMRYRDTGFDYVEDTAGDAQLTMTNSSGPVMRLAKNSDVYARFGLSADGTHYWGSGSASSWDVTLQRTAAAILSYTGGLKFLGGALSQKVVTLTDAATVATDASLGNVYLLGATASRTMGAPTNGVAGQVIHIKVKNVSGGAMTTTWNPAFHMAGAWTDPANNFARTVSFMFDGSSWYELSRAAADLA